MTENAINTWTKTMHCTAELSDAMKNIKSDEKSNTDHKETTPWRVKRDAEDFNKIFEWLQSHSLLEVATDLVYVNSRLLDEKHTVRCDKSIGPIVWKGLSGKWLTECTFKRKV